MYEYNFQTKLPKVSINQMAKIRPICSPCWWVHLQNIYSKQMEKGANPTTLSYNAGVVKIYNATNSMARF
jgi:hypothetical protein